MIEPPDYTRDFVKVPRSVLNALIENEVTLRVYLVLADRAAYRPGPRLIKGRLVHLELGQAVFGRAELAAGLGVGETQIRTAIGHLVDLGIIVVKSTSQVTSRGTLVTLVGYYGNADSSGEDRPADRPTDDQTATRPRPDRDQTATTNEDLKKGKKGRRERSERREVSEDALRLAQLLHELITNRSPQLTIAKRTDSERAKECQRWAVDIDKLHRIDGISLEHIERVIRWCQADSFWQSNILSGGKLREKYDTLEAQRARSGAAPTARNGHAGRAEPATAEQHNTYIGKDNPFS